MDNKLSELSKPVAYSLRFRNMHTGEPDKTINSNTTFSSLEKAKAYGLGTRYVTQDDGKIVSVRDPSQDPIVEPLYSQEYVSALLARIEELEWRELNSTELKELLTWHPTERSAATDPILWAAMRNKINFTLARVAADEAMKEQSNG